ncbi:MAG: hypothetical protein ACREUE_00680 [Panacagrimonas sp.]
MHASLICRECQDLAASYPKWALAQHLVSVTAESSGLSSSRHILIFRCKPIFSFSAASDAKPDGYGHKAAAGFSHYLLILQGIADGTCKNNSGGQRWWSRLQGPACDEGCASE